MGKLHDCWPVPTTPEKPPWPCRCSLGADHDADVCDRCPIPF
jgi:hypothetical protein